MRFDAPSLAVVGYMLGTEILLIMIRKQVVTETEAIAAIERVLLVLETNQEHQSGAMAQAFEGARGILESLRRVISGQV